MRPHLVDSAVAERVAKILARAAHWMLKHEHRGDFRPSLIRTPPGQHHFRAWRRSFLKRSRAVLGSQRSPETVLRASDLCLKRLDAKLSPRDKGDFQMLITLKLVALIAGAGTLVAMQSSPIFRSQSYGSGDTPMKPKPCARH
jgi:hypothetical protein